MWKIPTLRWLDSIRSWSGRTIPDLWLRTRCWVPRGLRILLDGFGLFTVYALGIMAVDLDRFATIQQDWDHSDITEILREQTRD